MPRELLHALAARVALPVFAAGLFLHAQGRIVAGPEVLISHDEDFAHVETMLAVDPDDASHLVASTIILPRDERGELLWRVLAYVSRDAGKTWKTSRLPEEYLSDPVVALTPRGTALFVSLRPPKSLSVFRSEDGGTTWRDRLELPFTDGAMIGVDWTRGGRRGRIYLAGRRGEERTDPIVVHASADEGRTFTTSVAVEKPLVGRVLSALVLQDGTLVIPFSTRVSRDVEQIDGVRSSDGGLTFSEPFRIATRPFETEGRFGDFAAATFAVGSYAGRERLYAVYTLTSGEPHARLVMKRSEDGGRTWSQPVKIAPGAAAQVTHGAANVTVNPSGQIGISWIERTIGQSRNDDPECQRLTCFNESYDLFFTASLNGGDTFLSPTRITSQSSTPKSKHAGRFLPGFDYMFAAPASDGNFHLLWPDARTGVFQLYTSAVRVQ